MDTVAKLRWQSICRRDALIPGAGVCALFGSEPVALFYLPDTTQQLYAVSDWDPIGQASVMSRGIVGDLDNRLVVASPLYKQHFDLETGLCLEDGSVALQVFPVRIEGDEVLLAASVLRG